MTFELLKFKPSLLSTYPNLILLKKHKCVIPFCLNESKKTVPKEQAEGSGSLVYSQ